MSTSEERETISAPTTPGQAEGSENIDGQSQSTPAPTTPGTAEGGTENPEEKPAEKSVDSTP